MGECKERPKYKNLSKRLSLPRRADLREEMPPILNVPGYLATEASFSSLMAYYKARVKK